MSIKMFWSMSHSHLSHGRITWTRAHHFHLHHITSSWWHYIMASTSSAENASLYTIMEGLIDGHSQHWRSGQLLRPPPASGPFQLLPFAYWLDGLPSPVSQERLLSLRLHRLHWYHLRLFFPLLAPFRCWQSLTRSRQEWNTLVSVSSHFICHPSHLTPFSFAEARGNVCLCHLPSFHYSPIDLLFNKPSLLSPARPRHTVKQPKFIFVIY